MPSLSEGFGLTVLEAMACGTPVIRAEAGALPEVTGQAAFGVDPLSVGDMTQAMQRLLSDDGLRSELRSKGMERAHQFLWQRSAERIWEVISNHA
jgi:glycosyltransferase involved in cell wall biosynthesis